MSSASKQIWMSRAMRKKSAPFENDPSWQKAFDQIERSDQSDAMKHVLACWTIERLMEHQSLPDKITSKKKTDAFAKSAMQIVKEDRSQFQMTGLISVICASLMSMFIRSSILGQYLINFSIDAAVGAIAAAFLLVNLGSQLRLVRIYGKNTDFVLLDVLSFGLWLLLCLMMKAFDTSLLVYFVCYLFEKKKFEKLTDQFLKNSFSASQIRQL